MDAKTIIELITTVGFPIVMCGALCYYIVKQNEKNRDETDKLAATINANTTILAELTTLIKTLIK